MSRRTLLIAAASLVALIAATAAVKATSKDSPQPARQARTGHVAAGSPSAAGVVAPLRLASLDGKKISLPANRPGALFSR